MAHYVLRHRLIVEGMTPDDVISEALVEIFARTPALHRFPGSMAKRVQALAAHVAHPHGHLHGRRHGDGRRRLPYPPQVDDDRSAPGLRQVRDL